jgi:hypothetical protein
MFLLPSIGIGIVFAVLLGGRLSRVLDVHLRCQLLVVLALGVQVILLSALSEGFSDLQERGLHVGSYALLIVFAVLNLRVWALIPVLLGTGLNALAIAANAGRMPVADHAAQAMGGLQPSEDSNVTTASDRLGFLGDMFALPAELPLTNVFSVGDLLIGFGMAAFIVAASLSRDGERALWPSRMMEPFRTRAYARLAAGRFVSQVGDWLTLAALIGWVYSSTESTAHVAGLLLVRLAPPILGGGIATLVVDRLPKQRLLVWVEVCRGVAVLCALAGVLGDDRMLVYGAFACSGALAAMSGAIVPAMVPSLLPVSQLASANAGLGMAKDAGMALGALGAGLALASVGPATALSIDALTFVAAFFLFRGVVLPRPMKQAPTTRLGARAADWKTVAQALERLGEWRDAATAWIRSAEACDGSGTHVAKAWATAASASEKVGAWEDAAAAWACSAEAWEESSSRRAVHAWEQSATAWSHAAKQERAAAAWKRRLAAEAHATAAEPDERDDAVEVGEGAIAGLRYLLGRRTVLLLISSFAVATLATGLTNATLPSFLEDVQGLGSGGYGFGIAALATGLLLGEALVGFSRVGATAGRWIGSGLIVMAALFVALALTVHAPTALLLLALIGLVDGTTDVLFETVVQRETDPRYLGCVFGFASAFVSATMTGAFAVAPLVGEVFEASGVIICAGVCLLGASVIALAATVRLGVTRLAPAPV